MKRNVLRKLRSNEGASLTFAILLFLVCAVIGSIVLTAGTIASGRLAEKAEMDQRYYYASSAAEFLKDTLGDKEVVIIRDKKSGSLKVEGYEYNDTGLIGTYDFLTLRTLELLENQTFDADLYSTTEKTASYTFEVQDQKTEAGINTTVVNGVMFLDISVDKYKIRMTFAPIISENSVKTDDTEVKTTTVKWAVTNIEKVFEYDE